MEVDWSAGFSGACSGDMYAAVPITPPSMVFVMSPLQSILERQNDSPRTPPTNLKFPNFKILILDARNTKRVHPRFAGTWGTYKPPRVGCPAGSCLEPSFSNVGTMRVTTITVRCVHNQSNVS